MRIDFEFQMTSGRILLTRAPKLKAPHRRDPLCRLSPFAGFRSDLGIIDQRAEAGAVGPAAGSQGTRLHRMQRLHGQRRHCEC